MDILNFLSYDTRTIAYRPELNTLTGSVTATILLQQMIYYASKAKGGEFYKFRSPCEHKKYAQGDSWVEFLGFGETEFDNALAKIAFKEGTGKKNKISREDAYVFYRTDLDRITWYRLNTELLKKRLSEIYVIDDSPITVVAEIKTTVVEESPSSAIVSKEDTKTNTESYCEGKVVERKNDGYKKILAYFNHPTPGSEEAQAQIRKQIRELKTVFHFDFGELEEYVFRQFEAYCELKRASPHGKHHTASNFLYSLREQNFEAMLAELNENVKDENLIELRDKYLYPLFDISDEQTEVRKTVNRFLACIERENRTKDFKKQFWAYYRYIIGFRDKNGFIFEGKGKTYCKNLKNYLLSWNDVDWDSKLQTELKEQKDKML